jgi:hypothetical protein
LKFLVDECLGLPLAEIAQAAGFPESAHVSRRGMAGWADWRLMQRIVEEDWTFVTRNSDDFRPRRGSASTAPCYIGVAIHAGPVCINPPAGVRGDIHLLYFRAAIESILSDPEMVNQVLEVWPGEDGKVTVERYAFPQGV